MEQTQLIIYAQELHTLGYNNVEKEISLSGSFYDFESGEMRQFTVVFEDYEFISMITPKAIREMKDNIIKRLKND